MCKHILNAQVSVRAPCCKRFFDCPLCHFEQNEDQHQLRKTIEMQFVCKKCKRAFRKDLTRFEEEDEFCPHCDNHFVIEAQTPGMQDPSGPSTRREGGENGEEGREDEILEPIRPDLEHSARILLDDRMRYDPRRDWVANDLSAGEKGERIDENGLIGILQEREDAERQALQASKNYSKIMNEVGAGSNAHRHTFDDQDDDLDWS